MSKVEKRTKNSVLTWSSLFTSKIHHFYYHHKVILSVGRVLCLWG